MTGTQWEVRRLLKEARAYTSGPDRYVDFGVELRTVVQDLSHGVVVIPGMAPVRTIRRRRLGGRWDTRTSQWAGPSVRPHIWYCSEVQEAVILHGDDLPPKILLYGGEGAGKSRTLAMWLTARAMAFAGHGGFIGATSPTRDKSLELLKALKAVLRPSWCRWRAAAREMALAIGITFQLRATKKQSDETGSPIQSFNWLCAASDEIQDSLDADADIEARLRASPGGRGMRLNTATAKDLPEWRSFRDRKLGSPGWVRVTMTGPSNPFVFPLHWENMRSLGDREYERRVWAKDLRPESATYPAWDREIHLMPIPDTARDITASALTLFESYLRPGGEFSMLAAHDPGEIQNTTELLRAFELRVRGRRVRAWMVVDEVITERTTSDQHAAALKHHVQKRYGLNLDPERGNPDAGLARLLVISDPHGPAEGRPDLDAYRSFQRHGLDIFRASPKRIKRNARVEMVNRLLMSSDKVARLYAACDHQRQPLCPRFVQSIEAQERDAAGKAEANRKNKRDVTHPTAAVGYGLWPFEREHVAEWAIGHVEGGA